MKRFLKKTVSYGIPEKWLGVCAVLLLTVMLVPIIRLALYTMPWYDDYSYAGYVKGFIDEYGLGGFLPGAVYVVKTWWWCWQGTFSSIFMMSLMPEAFGENLYPVGIMGIVIFFTIASLTFVKVVCANVLEAEKGIQISVAVLITLTMIELIYTAQQGIYWYNAAVHYTFMHGCLFLLLAVVVKLIYADTARRRLFFALLAAGMAFVCSGSNFVTALQGELLLLLFFVLCLLARKKCCFYLLPGICVYSFGLYMNISAPGNAIRGANYQGYSPIKSILLSFKSGMMHFEEFTGIITFIILVVYGLQIWNTIGRLNFSFPMPGVVSLLSFCFYCTGFTPSYYGMGTEGLSRTWVVIKFTLQMLIFLNVAYWMGWCMRQRRKRGKSVPEVKQWGWVYAVAGLAAVFWLVCNSNQAGSFASYGAYYYVHTGEAANLHNEYQQRIESIKNSNEDVVEVEPYFWKPWFLYKGELSENPSAEPNKAMASWFEKSGIYVKE